jgi:hypothetical protein
MPISGTGAARSLASMRDRRDRRGNMSQFSSKNRDHQPAMWSDLDHECNLVAASQK